MVWKKRTDKFEIIDSRIISVVEEEGTGKTGLLIETKEGKKYHIDANTEPLNIWLQVNYQF